MQVREIMTAQPVACAADDRVVTAAKIMMDRECGAVPVVDDQRLRHVIGIVTDRDIVYRLVARERNPLDAVVADCMTAHVCTVRPYDDVEDVAQMMEDKQIRRVVVVDETGRLAGIVATADLARKTHEEAMVGLVLEEISKPEPALAGR